MLSLILLTAIISAQPESLTYAKAREAAQEDHQPLVVYLSADWCGPCKLIKPDVLKTFADYHLALVNVDKEGQLAKTLIGKSSIPVLLIFRYKEDDSWTHTTYRGVDEIRQAILDESNLSSSE